MTNENENWKWWVGHDDERYHTECETREEAVYIATEEQEGGHIVEATKHGNLKISGWFDGHLFVENADENAFDDYGDTDRGDPVFDVTTEQIKDLEAMTRAAMDAWQEKHGLTFTGFVFKSARNHEYIPAKADP